LAFDLNYHLYLSFKLERFLMKDISRRNMIGTIAAGAVVSGTLISGGCCKSAPTTMKKLPKYPNEHFYKADGTFDADKAKAAYYEMMNFYNYPIVDRIKSDSEEFWTLDFGLGNFAESGMAGIFWVNNLKDNYFGHEIYLLPGQMIPEHWHMPTAKAGPKVEAWQLRHGGVTLYGEGTPTPGVDERIPPMHNKIAKARTETVLKPGEVGELSAPESRHFMLAGPQGAIVTEYATYHDGDGLRFTHPEAKL
jgi:D-lyxose ketol-isomerase